MGRAATLPVSFFERPTEQVARELLGCLIVSRAGRAVTVGRIVETEAYLGYRDPASHGYRHRRHARNEALFAPPGTWYVYLSYGVHWCCNLVTHRQGDGAAVLLRAIEPVEGLPAMRRRRGGTVDRLLGSGPGRLTQALGITLALDGRAMPASPVRIISGDAVPEHVIGVGPRVGITKAADWPLRFVQLGSPHLSRPLRS